MSDCQDCQDYDYNTSYNDSQFFKKPIDIKYLNTIRMLYITGYIIICTLGLVLNLLVIIAGICNNHISNTAKCILALAVTHLICSAFLPLQILYSWFHFNWHYGTALCKLSSYVFYASLFSTAGILTVWKLTYKCQGWHCNKFKHSSVVLLMILSTWTFAAVLGLPSLFSRELRYTVLGEQCIDDYDFDDKKTTQYGKTMITIVVCYRLLLGILIPVFLIGISRSCQRYRIMCLINVAYIVCWTPLLITAFLQVVLKEFDASSYGLPVTTVLAAAHCCVNPVIYILVNPDIKMLWMKQEQDFDESTNGYI
ncbi:chemerin-like receptor 1 [Clarias gariepinus]|uniref:chemerin-like receptor 1 n=1 Tax=Clarias gariepinus TaxID=13013 RepID=UPI00234E32C2|nr:chemerin-like receptor 1 [Clarias gariepinus]